MKRLKEQSGSALLLALAVVIIFTILGFSLMTITSTGIAKNNSRQDNVKATDLADKGVQYMMNDLQKFLEDKLKNGGVSKNEFAKLLEDTFGNEKYLCKEDGSGGFTIPSDNGSETKVCIEKVELISNDEKDQFKRYITFKSTGIVNGKVKTIRTKVLYGTDAIPDQLKYAISTNEDGNLYLHGGVEIQGDVKVDGNLILSEQATWMNGNTPMWESSVPASIIKNSGSATPKLIMNPNKNFYILNTSDKPNYNDHINGSKLSETKHYSVLSPTTSNASTTFSSKFFNTNNLKVVTKDLPDDVVNVSQIVSSKKNINTKYKNLNISSNSNNSTNPLKSLSKTKEVFIDKDTYCSLWFGVCWEYSDTNALTINSGGNEIHLTGQLFLNGNLSITNTNLKSNALIYVNGDVLIRDSVLNGLDKNSTLIIFATGEIHISNISEYQDTSSKIKGFFYTQKNMIMYGVGSNIELQGGISAKQLILTAVRGTTIKKDNKLTVDSIDNQKKKASRLKVIYDQNLISEYTEFKRDQEEEFITEINKPVIVNRKYN